MQGGGRFDGREAAVVGLCIVTRIVLRDAVVVDSGVAGSGEDFQSVLVGDLGPRARGVIASAALGVIVGALGVLAAVLVLELSDDRTYAPLVGAVAIAVWVAGGTGGVAAIVTGWAIAVWALTAPRVSFPVGADVDLRWAVALVVGIVVAGVGIGMRRGHERAADAAEREERSRLRVERLQALAASLSAALTVEEVARVMVEGVSRGDRRPRWRARPRRGRRARDRRSAGARGQTLRPGSRLPLTTRAPITTAAREGKPAWAQRRREFVSRFPDGAALAPYASGALAVPVFIGERLAGAMGFPFRIRMRSRQRCALVARIAADLGGQALERAGVLRAGAELPRGARSDPRRRAALPAGRDPQRRWQLSVCAEARRAFGCDVVQVWTPVDGDQLEVTWRDPPSDVIPPGTRIDFADFPGLIDEMRAFRSMFVPNAQEHTRGEALRHAQRARAVLVAADPDRDRRAVRADPGAAVGA